jgi:integrase
VSALGPTLEAFFVERLMTQRRASQHTIAAYRDTWCLLLRFAQHETGKLPASLQIDDLDAGLIGRFLDHLERDRRNSARTRNARLSAVHSMFRFALLRHPEHAGTIGRVLAIPPKRFERPVLTFLDDLEVTALLEAPDRTTFLGRRDHTLLAVAIQTGLRVSELTALTWDDVVLGTGTHLRCHGKGRKARATPLTPRTASLLRAWRAECRGALEDPVFATRQGGALGRYAVTALLARHVHVAVQRCPSLATKTVSPHTLRHTCAMRLRHAGVDSSVIALWLGHEGVETTQMYLHADLTIKERALARTAPMKAKLARYRPPDSVMAFLEAL